MFLGIDTSNYTTSVALYDGNSIVQKKKLLSVKRNERGLRQSDAVFQHTVNLHQLIKELDFTNRSLSAVGVSSRPRNVENSYMPCFLVGLNTAESISHINNVPLFKTSHQVGHILAALYSCDRLDLIKENFIAFHISGGTTEALLITPDNDEIIKAQLIGHSTDLKAGQAIDRAGVMLGLDFPCGKELDRLSLLTDKEFKIKPSVKGTDCSLSGLENKARKMFEENYDKCDIAKFVISYICQTIDQMTNNLLLQYGNLPVVFAGGVMSNTIIKEKLSNKYSAYFASPEFSCDNASGTAIYAHLKDNL